MIDLEGIGEAQADFRNANETIQASAERMGIASAIPFICECPDEDCADVVYLTFDEYEAIRRHARRFFNVSGHEFSSVEAGAERIVAVAGELTVVEKIGIAGEIAANAHSGRS